MSAGATPTPTRSRRGERRRYGEAEWSEIRRESEQIVRELVDLMRAGSPADGAAARALAERHRDHISRWFYPCSPAMHRGLAEMYVADERFTRTYEREAEGLAAYFHDAIVANADALRNGRGSVGDRDVAGLLGTRRASQALIAG